MNVASRDYDGDDDDDYDGDDVDCHPMTKMTNSNRLFAYDDSSYVDDFVDDYGDCVPFRLDSVAYPNLIGYW